MTGLGSPAVGPRIALIVAVARNGIIGRDGGLPWRMPSDLKTFRRLTMGKPMIMGRRTFASLGKPLDGRDNLVVTRDRTFNAPGTEVFHDFDTALARAKELAAARPTSEIMVIGGGELYRTALPSADRLYWTEIDADIDGDTSFPPLDPADWRETGRDPIPQGPRDDHPATLLTLDRNRP
ncbi:MAG: dihydrofolate reductase [Hyphomicrobiaceae bacterium]|nr:dihydrofolate reductase [Hyphomicrobiaceae bacterium]